MNLEEFYNQYNKTWKDFENKYNKVQKMLNDFFSPRNRVLEVKYFFDEDEFKKYPKKDVLRYFGLAENNFKNSVELTELITDFKDLNIHFSGSDEDRLILEIPLINKMRENGLDSILDFWSAEGELDWNDYFGKAVLDVSHPSNEMLKMPKFEEILSQVSEEEISDVKNNKEEYLKSNKELVEEYMKELNEYEKQLMFIDNLINEKLKIDLTSDMYTIIENEEEYKEYV